MTVTNFKQAPHFQNPLDEFEDLLEASNYAFERQGQTRLTFSCTGKGGAYLIVVEWNEDAHAVRCSLIMTATQGVDVDRIMTHISTLNDVVWNGYFITDGVGNTIFKIVKELPEGDAIQLFEIEDTIDTAVNEMDRFAVAIECEANDTDSLFSTDTDDQDQDLLLLLTHTLGSA